MARGMRYIKGVRLFPMQTSALSKGPHVDEEPRTAEAERPGTPLATLTAQEWAPGLLFLACDVVCWVAIYALFSYLRHDAFFSSGFEFMVIDLILLAVILQALFIIGGYSSRAEMRGLNYTTEHILAVLSALAIGSFILTRLQHLTRP